MLTLSFHRTAPKKKRKASGNEPYLSEKGINEFEKKKRVTCPSLTKKVTVGLYKQRSKSFPS